MTEKPILFSAPMVRAILAGEKTQTRRVPQYKTSCLGNRVMRPIPYGIAGDQLWIRETFIHRPADYCPEASTTVPSLPSETIYRADVTEPGYGPWKPSIFMPRALSRIQLEVTDVRVERLQEISVFDAVAEGVSQFALNPVRKYRELWDSLNAKRGFGWDRNPHVWVVCFRRIKP